MRFYTRPQPMCKPNRRTARPAAPFGAGILAWRPSSGPQPFDAADLAWWVGQSVEHEEEQPVDEMDALEAAYQAQFQEHFEPVGRCVVCGEPADDADDCLCSTHWIEQVEREQGMRPKDIVVI